jgi:hypothetical protein
VTVAALKGIFIQAKGYTRGRSASVRLLVLHTAEGSTSVRGLGNYFAGTTKGSSNAGVGQDGAYGEFVTYNNTPWTNPPVNTVADTLEICGFRSWSRAKWLSYPKMLDTVARWIAWRAAVRGIPIKRVRADGRGVCDHMDVNNVYHKSSHTDIGPGFPWDVVMAKAAAYAKVPVAPVVHHTPTPAPVVKPGVKAPVFPLPRGSYFGPRTGPRNSVSGYYSHSEDYKRWQIQMQRRGWKIAADGHYDVGRDDVIIKAFQKDKHLPQDGLVGPVVWALAWTAPVTK